MKKRKLVSLVLVVIFILSTSLVAFGETNILKSPSLYSGLIYDSFSGQKVGNLTVREINMKDGYRYKIYYNKRIINVSVDTETLEEIEEIRNAIVRGKGSLTVDTKNFDLQELVRNEETLAGNFISQGGNFGFLVSKSELDEEAFLNWMSENRRLSEERAQEEFFPMSVDPKERGTVMNTWARLSCLGNSPIPLQTQAFRYRLQTRGVADSFTTSQRVTRTLINPKTNTNLNFGGDQYPTTSSSTFPVSISLAYNLFSVILSYTTQSISYTDGNSSVRWIQNGSWTPNQMNYTGSDNTSRGHGSRIQIQPSSAARNSTQMSEMYAEYTVRTTGELWSSFDTYSVSGHYWITYD